MTLTDSISLLLRAKALPDLVEAGRHLGPTTGTDNEVKAAWEGLKSHLAANNHRPAVAIALALLWLNSDDTVRRIRKEGLLRASRYSYTAGRSCPDRPGKRGIRRLKYDLSRKRDQDLAFMRSVKVRASGTGACCLSLYRCCQRLAITTMTVHPARAFVEHESCNRGCTLPPVARPDLL